MENASCGHYQPAGHARKLHPIIQSLDHFDNDPKAWEEVKTLVKQINCNWERLLLTVPAEEIAVREALERQRDLTLDALRLQSNLFHGHRNTCVRALRLQRE
tara:strand:- start:32 stop:337 length:306 start_codon:yes stop_codon:yes gene_type:complete